MTCFRAVAAALVFATATPVLAADIDIGAVAGVYKKTFPNGNIDGGKYQSEDTLEIMKVSPATAYIRIHLEFFNGHICNIAGVAASESGALVYRGPTNFQGKPCVLSLKKSGGKLTMADQDGACTIGTCGNRGMYTGAAFELKRRRTIRYMDVILKSDDYKAAVKEYDDKTPR